MKVCVICGKEFELLKTQNTSRKTCSPTCHSELMRKLKLGENNAAWKGGHSEAHYMRVRKETKEQKCEMCCGKRPFVRLDTHHIDHNKQNNTPENIRVLCVSCHAKWHYQNGDAKIRGA